MYPGTHAERTPDKAAIVFPESGEVVTYRQLDEESSRLARALRAEGLAFGDVLGILMGNHRHLFTACWAAQRSGLRYVPINRHLTAEEVAYVVDDSGSKALVVGAEGAAAGEAVLRDRPKLLGFAVDVDLPGGRDLDAAMAAQPGGSLEEELEGSDMVYSSGTTGRPKGGARPLARRDPRAFDPRSLGFYRRFGLDEHAVYLTPGAPLYHAAPLRFSMAVHRFGGTNVVLERFDPGAALRALVDQGITHSQWVPTMFVRLLRLPPEERAELVAPQHRVAVHSAAPCPPQVKEQMIEWWGPILHEYYGGSEGGCLTHITSPEWLAHRGSVGRAVVGTVHILDDDGQEVAPGVPGLVYSEGGRPVDYLNDPDKTAAAHDPRGWVTVGDVGHLDDEGYLYLADRKDDLIITGGVNVYPREVEDVLLSHPAVGDVAVIGLPDDDLGQSVTAVVELLDSAPEPAVADELVAHCRARLAGFKCPRAIEFVDALPRTPAGKLQKRHLVDRFRSAVAAPVPPSPEASP